MIISASSAAFGLILLVAAVLLGANDMTLASIFLLCAVPTLFQAVRTLFGTQEEPSGRVGETEDHAQAQRLPDATENDGCRICADEIPPFLIRAPARKPTA